MIQVIISKNIMEKNAVIKIMTDYIIFSSNSGDKRKCGNGHRRKKLVRLYTWRTREELQLSCIDDNY